jgi:hypothetical protein
MLGKRDNAVVVRIYQEAPDECVRALELLLKTPASKEAVPANRPDDAKGSKHDRANPRIP